MSSTGTSSNTIELTSLAYGINTQFVSFSSNLLQITSEAISSTGISGTSSNILSITSNASGDAGVSGTVSQTIFFGSIASDTSKTKSSFFMSSS